MSFPLCPTVVSEFRWNQNCKRLWPRSGVSNAWLHTLLVCWLVLSSESFCEQVFILLYIFISHCSLEVFQTSCTQFPERLTPVRKLVSMQSVLRAWPECLRLPKPPPSPPPSAAGCEVLPTGPQSILRDSPAPRRTAAPFRREICFTVDVDRSKAVKVDLRGKKMYSDGT